MEQWKPLTDRIEVSSDGRVRKDGRILKPSAKGGHGYLRVSTGLKERYVHRLVLKAFKPQPPGRTYANHINGNKQDNRVSNLEWSTGRENTLLAARSGRFSGKRYGPTPVKVIWKDGTYAIFGSQKEANDAIGGDKKASGINKALKGDRKTTHGVRVEYCNPEPIKPMQMSLEEFGL